MDGHGRWPAALLALAVAGGGLLSKGCATAVVVDRPLAQLESTEEGSNVHLAAMSALDEMPTDPGYIETLQRIVWRPGYTVAVREAAVERLERYDLEGLKRTLRQRLPNMNAWAGLERLCEIIADEGWTDLTPALASSWARPRAGMTDEMDRPEYKALARLYGPEGVTDAVFELLLASSRPSQQGLRTRCWQLLQRIGEEERLAELLTSSSIPPDDGFMQDLQAAQRDWGVAPEMREEILWIRKLRDPDHRGFWDEATVAVGRLPAARRRELELRDVPVVVAVARHEPDLLERAPAAIQATLEDELRDRKHYAAGSNFDSMGSNRRDRLHDWRGELTWGDLAAVRIALSAMAVPQVVDHLFDYAARDQADESTEYGGVIALDHRGRFEVLEFPPRTRHHDQKFIASQEMLNAAYTALFHFHFHVQRDRNEEYAGPGFGDINYADNTRANCLVFTAVGEGRMNVDYYRHGRVLIDLGVIRARAASSS